MYVMGGRLQSTRCTLPIMSDAQISDLTGSSKLLVPGKVVSSTRIPQGAMSMPIHPRLLKGDTEIIQISVGTNLFGTLDLDSSSSNIWDSNVHWTRALRLADDCHSFNIQLRKDPHHNPIENEGSVQKLVLQAVRPVEPGQELLLWFSEDILATLHMGFLTPANIQGQKNYVCTRCSALYESPNPLKLHLTLGCGKQSMSWLWEKLSLAFSQPISHSNEFNFKLLNEPYIPKQKNAIDLSAPVERKTKNAEDNNEKEHNSAFKPFKKLSNNLTYPLYSPWPRFTMPSNYIHTPFPVADQLQKNCNSDAQIETLVSSLGKYKEGHICLYCGKSYSRKYGLKIHIRTHTGYKPLKCKFCLRPFGDPSNLNKHVRLHAEGETPYKCDLCGKVLVRRRDLERHLKSRHATEMNPSETFLNDDSSINSMGSTSDDEHKNEVRTESTDELISPHSVQSIVNIT